MKEELKRFRKRTKTERFGVNMGASNIRTKFKRDGAEIVSVATYQKQKKSRDNLGDCAGQTIAQRRLMNSLIIGYRRRREKICGEEIPSCIAFNRAPEGREIG